MNPAQEQLWLIVTRIAQDLIDKYPTMGENELMLMYINKLIDVCSQVGLVQRKDLV